MAQGGEFANLLHREGKPALELGVELGFRIEIDGDVQQGTGWGEHEMVQPSLIRNRLEPIQHGTKIAAPDVAPIHHAERKNKVGWRLGESAVKLCRCADKIKMKAADRQAESHVEIVADIAEIGGEQQLQSGCGGSQHRKGGLEGSTRSVTEVAHQARFVDLHPICACRRELA